MRYVTAICYLLFMAAAARSDDSLGRVDQFQLADSTGASVTQAAWNDATAVVLIFLGTECPVSNGYAPEIVRLNKDYSRRGVRFFGVHGDPDVTAETARKHAAEYGLTMPILLDPTQTLARPTRVTMMPECVVLLPDGQVVYRGRIDNRYLESGQRRLEATRRDLSEAITAVLAGKKPSPATTKAFGCPLPRLQSQ